MDIAVCTKDIINHAIQVKPLFKKGACLIVELLALGKSYPVI
jgi:hypothetical protein